jgi:DNA uptake protein ComE-like DNA-binding protein
MWKDFFYFSNREKKGIVLLLAIVAGIFIGKFLFSPKPQSEIINQQSEITNPQSETVNQNSTIVIPQSELPEQQSKIENKNSSIINQKSQISNTQSETRTYYNQPQSAEPDRPRYPQQEKLSAGQVVELNSADTALLKKIPGIGSSFAKRITGYRRLLGGYYRIEQLQEVYGMYEELYTRLVPWFSIDTALIEPLNANTASLDRLRAHPYIDSYQAIAIVELRKKRSKIDSFEQLLMLEEFAKPENERIRNYLKFE